MKDTKLEIKGIELLDTTLRDGSYVVDFQFTHRDTSILALALEEAGFRWIEVGHGMGLNASSSGKGEAAATDREYLNAASSVLRKARFGTFFIPGIGRKADLEMARSAGMSFVRIGTNANEIEKARSYIRYAKSLGFIVSSNLMKSYVLGPDELLANASRAADWGADIICLVDSAGGMLPEDVEAYLARLSRLKGVTLGFHGHNNLGLAVANTLKSIECGAKLVDVSLQGIGRSAGNAPAEMVAAILKKRCGLAAEINLNKMLELSHKIVAPMMRNYGVDPISVISGYAKFHSGFSRLVHKYAEKYGVDPKELIVGVSAIDQANVSEADVKGLAAKLGRNKPALAPHRLDVGFGPKFNGKDFLSYDNLKVNLGSLCRQLNSFSKKYGKLSVVTIAINGKKRMSISRFVQESPSFVIGTVEIGEESVLAKALDFVDGRIEYILLDCEAKMRRKVFDIAKDRIKRSKMLVYKSNDAWARSIFLQLVNLLPDTGSKITIFGFNNLAVKLAISLAEVGFETVLTLGSENPERAGRILDSINSILIKGAGPIKFEQDEAKAARRAAVLVGLFPGTVVIDGPAVESMKKGGFILDGSLGSVSRSALAKACSLGMKVIRVDMGPVIAAEAASGLRMKDLLESRMGKGKIENVSCVAGGVFGSKGDIILDSMKNPDFVVGLADGRGSVIYDPVRKSDRMKIRKVEKALALMKVL